MIVKKAIVLVFGADAGIAYAAMMKRLFGVVVEGGGAMSVAAAESALDDQAQMVDELAEALGHQQAATTEIAGILKENETRSEQLRTQIQRLMTATPPNREAARPLAAELQAIDGILPGLQDRLTQANEGVLSVQGQLQQAEQKLNEMTAQQQANEASARVNQALERANARLKQVSTNHQKVFDRASESIKRAGTTTDAVRTARLSVGAGSRAAQQSETDAFLDSFTRQ